MSLTTNLPLDSASSLLKLPIGIATAIVCIYTAYRRIAKPPRSLRHIDHTSSFRYLWSFLINQPVHEIVTQITLPVALKSDHGLYTCLDWNGWAVRTTRPGAVKKLLFKTDIFPKSTATGYLKGTLLGRFALGPNILFLNGDRWMTQRMIANPAFHRSMPVDLFGQLTQDLFRQMDSMLGSSIDFRDMVGRWTLDAIGLAGFDFNFHAITKPDNEWVKRYDSIVNSIGDTKFLLFPSLEKHFLPFFPARKKKHEELTVFLDTLQQIISRKRESLQAIKNLNVKQSEKDLLTLMLEAGEEGNGVMTDDELMSNMCIFFTAGHDTTTNALSYAAYYLATNLDIQRKAREEAIRVLGDDPTDILPTAEELRNMPYINMVIKETLRMNPPVTSIIGRSATQDTDLSGVFIPKGTRVVCSLYEVQHNPTVWNDPEIFNPERFAPGGEAEKVAKAGLAWIPFSNGARQCIGMNFSLAEQRVLLPMLLRKYELTLPEDSIHKDELQSGGHFVMFPLDMMLSFKKLY